IRSGPYRAVAADTVTDAQGRYEIASLGEGLVRELTASKEGWVQVPDLSDGQFDVMIPFRDGGTWTRDLVLARGGRLVATIRGPDGPVPGAKVTLLSWG